VVSVKGEDPMSMKMCAAAVVVATGAASAGIATLDAAMTVDNLFRASISASATDAGDVFLTGGSWPSTFTGSADVMAPGTYYLHVFAQDTGFPAMFIGNFSLTGDAAFANGTQNLLTDASTGDWSASLTGFGAAPANVFDLGPRGTGPWGLLSPALGDARFIWANDPAVGGSPAIVYFTAEFTVIPGVPAASVIAGGLALAARHRR
jgi:hypothetical protein